ncbi:hypothetical protein SDC9_88907 [bioreactor metagenome]|uniref:Uncharacterized protein n=1 Tax=bioreactor metagenome TaxID=1076179 RepID=A0A644ZN29_9ZZZZ
MLRGLTLGLPCPSYSSGSKVSLYCANSSAVSGTISASFFAPVKVQPTATTATSTTAITAGMRNFGFFAMSAMRSFIPFLPSVMVVAQQSRSMALRFSQVSPISVRPYSMRASSPMRLMVPSSQASSESLRESAAASQTSGLYQCAARPKPRSADQMWSP